MEYMDQKWEMGNGRPDPRVLLAMGNGRPDPRVL